MNPQKLVQLEDYEQLVGPRNIERIRKKAKSLRHLHVVHVNSSYSGGGVAELLTSLTLLMNSVGHRDRLEGHPWATRFLQHHQEDAQRPPGREDQPE